MDNSGSLKNNPNKREERPVTDSYFNKYYVLMSLGLIVFIFFILSLVFILEKDALFPETPAQKVEGAKKGTEQSKIDTVPKKPEIKNKTDIPPDFPKDKPVETLPPEDKIPPDSQPLPINGEFVDNRTNSLREILGNEMPKAPERKPGRSKERFYSRNDMRWLSKSLKTWITSLESLSYDDYTKLLKRVDESDGELSSTSNSPAKYFFIESGKVFHVNSLNEIRSLSRVPMEIFFQNIKHSRRRRRRKTVPKKQYSYIRLRYDFEKDTWLRRDVGTTVKHAVYAREMMAHLRERQYRLTDEIKRLESGLKYAKYESEEKELQAELENAQKEILVIKATLKRYEEVYADLANGRKWVQVSPFSNSKKEKESLPSKLHGIYESYLCFANYELRQKSKGVRWTSESVDRIERNLARLEGRSPKLILKRKPAKKPRRKLYLPPVPKRIMSKKEIARQKTERKKSIVRIKARKKEELEKLRQLKEKLRLAKEKIQKYKKEYQKLNSLIAKGLLTGEAQ